MPVPSPETRDYSAPWYVVMHQPWFVVNRERDRYPFDDWASAAAFLESCARAWALRVNGDSETPWWRPLPENERRAIVLVDTDDTYQIVWQVMTGEQLAEDDDRSTRFHTGGPYVDEDDELEADLRSLPEEVKETFHGFDHLVSELRDLRTMVTYANTRGMVGYQNADRTIAGLIEAETGLLDQRSQLRIGIGVDAE